MKLGPLLVEEQDIMDASVRESLAIASLTPLQEQSPSIATGSWVLEIICIQPMLQRLAQRLMDAWDSMDIALRVRHAMSFLIMDDHESQVHNINLHYH